MSPQPHPAPSRAIQAALAAIAATALAVPAAVAYWAPPIVPTRPHLARLQQRIVPQAVVPPVEPVEFVDLAPDDARAFNAREPFSTDPIPAARAFRLNEGPEDLARATDCLATAVLYEAGADPAGQRAVAQVVLNRVRHPAFPKTVCGVVFEGQERRTGCQFSFTCDGALTRWSPPVALWAGARKVATAALAGAVYRPVGWATHYHTDWVVPYWQSSLDKIAKVGTHLFFRWTGWWGTPPAFSRRVTPGEPAIAQIAPFSDAHRTGAALDDAGAALDEAAALLAPGTFRPVATDADAFLVTLPPGSGPETWPALARQACAERPRCRFSAWNAAARTPAALPLTPDQVAGMTFSYLRDRAAGLERTLWNCREVRRQNPRECMRQQLLLTAVPVTFSLPAASPTPTAPARAATTPVRGPTDLGGVRRSGPAELGGIRRAGSATQSQPAAQPTPRASPTPSLQRKQGPSSTERDQAAGRPQPTLG